MVRLFVALSPPPKALAEVAEAVEPHRGGWPDLRWVAPELWHVTMAFLGEVGEETLPRLATRLARAAGRYPPMTLSFGAGGAFSSPSRAQVVWLGLRGGGAELSRLAASLAAGARRAGAAQTSDKPFRPHLTLARARPRGGVDARPLVEALAAFDGTPWRAEEVHLVRSHLGASVRYEVLAAWPLTGHG
ncbi:RNA 2',3'-cyclic phosphodiesterase [Sphaerisporangium melleum]|uniref:RNA 2',3'-cyclic phosphodiesterase n=1 Tax=Sphaerisporangium melleum TaxID=321316 RepID=A0A917R9D6_9ACTN|nr:RNA 2',3'-cyclic phosphodiesterase [Sphaerisporangium melleum]GGK96711.1 RNA 2',3'-cyclic phosphodiesterase [Sphaerisporangium melleum]GII71028.1 RNA 2',3'-cyclic phosphodiesterase [Sphaerisporangium melleum]